MFAATFADTDVVVWEEGLRRRVVFALKHVKTPFFNQALSKLRRRSVDPVDVLDGLIDKTNKEFLVRSLMAVECCLIQHGF